MQVTSRPIEIQNRGNVAAMEPMQKMPELQTMRIGWPGLAGPEIIVYKTNIHAKSGEPPLPVPTVWLTPPRGAPWHFTGLTENGLAAGRAVPSPALGWRGTKQAVACAALVILLLILMRALDRYRPLLRFRARRARERVGNQIIYHRNRESQEVAVDLPSFPSESSDSFSTRDLPPSYFECSETMPQVENKFGSPDEPPPPYAYATIVILRNLGGSEEIRPSIVDTGQTQSSNVCINLVESLTDDVQLDRDRSHAYLTAYQSLATVRSVAPNGPDDVHEEHNASKDSVNLTDADPINMAKK